MLRQEGEWLSIIFRPGISLLVHGEKPGAGRQHLQALQEFDEGAPLKIRQSRKRRLGRQRFAAMCQDSLS